MNSLDMLQALFSSCGSKVKAIEYQLKPLGYLLIEIAAEADEAESAIRAVSPDFYRLNAAGSHGLSGIIITCCNGTRPKLVQNDCK